VKKLIATVLLIPSFSTLSFAQGYIFGVKTPIEQRAVNDEIKGGQVEKDFISFYLSPKETGKSSPFRAYNDAEDRDSYVVFGVRVPVNPGS
jgi:hypothetical protein